MKWVPAILCVIVGLAAIALFFFFMAWIVFPLLNIFIG